MAEQNTPRVSGSLWRVLREKLAARIDSAADMVEADQLVSAYCSDDVHDHQRLVGELERAFKIQLDATALESIKTVGELAERIAACKSEGKTGKRVYIVIYKNDEGRIIEEHVRADNHEAAIEALRETGLEEVLSVAREEDEDKSGHGHNVRNHWNGCVIPFVFALLGAAAVVGFFWLRRH